jgi:serine/threonine protein phosphatase PrpC
MPVNSWDWEILLAEKLTLRFDAGEMSGTTATLVVIDGFTVTVASVGDSRCILDTQGGVVSLLTVDHRLEENAEERERVTASGGEVSRLNLCGGQQVAL